MKISNKYKLKRELKKFTYSYDFLNNSSEDFIKDWLKEVTRFMIRTEIIEPILKQGYLPTNKK